jgi:hypothetical protein
MLGNKIEINQFKKKKTNQCQALKPTTLVMNLRLTTWKAYYKN